MVGQSVFGVHYCFPPVTDCEMAFRLLVGRVEDVAKCRAVFRQGEILQVEKEIRFAESDDEDAFPVLRHPVAGVEDTSVDLVSELAKRTFNHLEGPAFVVTTKVFDIFEEEHWRFFYGEDLENIEEKRSLSLVLKAVCPSEAVFLGNTRQGEGLTGKPGEQNIVPGNSVLVDFGDVAFDWVAVGMVGGIGFDRVRVPLRCVDAPAAEGFESRPESSDSCKQVDESEARIRPQRFGSLDEKVAKRRHNELGNRGFPGLPPADCFFALAQSRGNFGLRVEAAGFFKSFFGQFWEIHADIVSGLAPRFKS